MESTNQWQGIQQALRGSMSPASYENWLEPVQFSHIGSERDLHLVAPNSAVRDWLELELRADIVSAARASGLNVATLSVEIAEPEPHLHQASLVFDPEPPRFNQRYTFDRFVVGACNEFAHAASQAVASRPAISYNPLYVYSGVGMGKTHLLHAIGHYMHRRDTSMKIVYTSAEEFMNEMIKSIRYSNMRSFHDRYRKADALLVDDIQTIGSKERTQEEFFHTFNALHNSGKQIVISSDSDPETIPGLVGRLKSRFSWGLMADIQAPDLETKMAILDRRAGEAGVQLPEDVRSYVAMQHIANIRKLEGVLNRLVARAQFMQSPITLGMVRHMFASMKLDAPTVPDLETIQQAVAAKFDITITQLRSRNNARNVSQPRQVAMYLCKRLTDSSLTQIGKAFQKHHTTVMHGIRNTEQRLQKDSELGSQVEELTASIRASTQSLSE